MKLDRIIEFRGKPCYKDDIDRYGEWVYGDLIQDASYDSPKIRFFCDDVDKGGIDYLSVFVRPGTVGQYTEIQDADGNKIYEGDILRDESGSTRQVRYIDGCPHAIGIDNKGFELLYIKHCTSSDTPHWVVVGNRADNPSLLVNYGIDCNLFKETK